MTTTYAPRMISDKQVAFIAKLVSEKQVPEGLIVDTAGFSSKRASGLIDILLAQPKRKATEAARTEDLTDGMYRTLYNDIFKVYIGQSGRLLAKQLMHDGDGTDVWFFEYRGMAERFVKAGDKMTLEAAKQFGQIYGVCCNCGRTLTDEGSIAAGIGPVCAGKF